MQGSPKSISLNTSLRFQKTHKTQLLPAYLQFKKQHQHQFTPQIISEIKRIYQHGVCGKNSYGHTVVVDRVGQLKLQVMTKVIDYEEMIMYFYQRLLVLAEQTLGKEEEVIWIIDLSGKLMQLASKKVIDSISAMIVTVQKFFPCLLHKLIFVNTPMLFDTIWNKISSSVDKQTLDKIIMLGEQHDSLYDYVSPKCLPEFLGGELEEEQWIWGQTKQKQQSSQEEEADFSQLKMALGGMKFSGNSLKSVSQTPLNTEADDQK